MKIKINRTYTEPEFMEQVKGDIKEFNERYTLADVINAFTAQTEKHIGNCGQVVKVDADAFPAGWAFGNVTSFSFDILLDRTYKIVRVHFYTDIDLNVDTRAHMVTVTEYKQIA